MRTCPCGKYIPNSRMIDGKKRNLQNRTKCLDCLPFGSSHYNMKTEEERKFANNKKSQKHYQRLKEELGKDPVRLIREGRKYELVQAIGGKCQICGYNRLIRNLAFHHLHAKEFDISSRAFQFSPEKILNEVKKCVLVCHNCHGEIHDHLISNEQVKTAHLELLEKIKHFSLRSGVQIINSLNAVTLPSLNNIYKI